MRVNTNTKNSQKYFFHPYNATISAQLAHYNRLKRIIFKRRTLKMKNSEKTNRNGKKGSFFKNLSDRLREKDEIEVRARISALVDFALCTAIAYMIGGAQLFFNTYPICIALLCSSRARLLPVSLGLVILIASKSLPDVYVFACIAVPLVRLLTIFVPVMFDEMKKSPTPSSALVEYTENLPINKNSRPNEQSNKRTGEKTATAANEQTHLKLFDESLGAKTLSSLISGLICGIFIMIQGDFSLFSLYSTLSLTILCPIATAILGGYLGEQRYIKKPYTLLAIGAIIALSVYTAEPMTVIGMPMAPFLAMLFTLYMTSTQGILIGGIAAMICGLVYAPVHMPLFVICAILFALISALKRNAGLAVVCAAVVVWCYYIGGSQGLIEVLPPTLLAIPVYMIADKYREIILSPFDKNAVMAGGVYFAQAVTEKNKNTAVRERLGALSEAFSVLSENFYKLSDRRRRPDALGLKKLSEASFEKNCDTCPRREECWGDEYANTLEAIKRAATALHRKGKVSLSDIGEDFEARCVRAEKVLTDLNLSLSKATESVIKDDKLGFLASSYDDINEILRDALECDSEEYECDKDAQEKILDALFNEGFRASGVVVFGKRCKRITVKGMSGVNTVNAKRASTIRRFAEEIVGSSLTDPVFESGADGTVMHMCSRPLYRARYAYGRIAAEDRSEPRLDKSSLYVDPFADTEQKEEPCGDTANAFITNSSYFYSLISDGMGSGAEAAFISGVCSMFIEKMLSAGNRSDITVRMLNNVLRNENMGSGGECSATVDLCELDLISGTASFLKSGAAPTYIARGGTVYKVYSRTMPIGILKNADTRISKFDTQKGDIIIMMSDGCCPDSEDCPWLVEYLCEYMSKKDKNALGQDAECESLKDTLLSLAVKSFPTGKERDDISLSVIMIE